MNIVTIFGASGFIGRYVVREIAKTGARVRAAIRRPERAGFLKPMGTVGQIVPVAANIRDDSSVAAAVAGADTVINLVGILQSNGPQNFSSLQAEGPGRVAKAALAAGVKSFVQISAIGADSQSDSIYASTKGIGEQQVRDIFPNAHILRPSIVFGPEDDFFNKFAAMARFSPILPLIGFGTTKFQPVYVGDVADAVAAVAGDAGMAGGTFELGGPNIYTFRDLLEITLTQTSRRRLLLPIPFLIAHIQAAVAELAFAVPTALNLGPVSPITRDQVRLLRKDNVTSGDLPGLDDLGIRATALNAILPTYLKRYRRGTWHT